MPVLAGRRRMEDVVGGPLQTVGQYTGTRGHRQSRDRDEHRGGGNPDTGTESRRPTEHGWRMDSFTAASRSAAARNSATASCSRLSSPGVAGAAAASINRPKRSPRGARRLSSRSARRRVIRPGRRIMIYQRFGTG